MTSEAHAPVVRNASSRINQTFAWVLIAIGAAARVAPFFNQGGRLLRQYPTEDGYLMLTLARNIALGNGMSTAEGTIPSNGTQPLATLVWSLVYLLVGGDKTLGVVGVLMLEVLFAMASALAIYRLARFVLDDHHNERRATTLVASSQAHTRALWAAAIWFAHPRVVAHGMNCLETGLYGLLLIGTLMLILRPQPTGGLALGHWARIGAALGVTFWARNDAILSCLALGVVHLVWGLPRAPEKFAQRFVQLSLAGVIVGMIASPWLIFNQVGFGSLMPISGQAESIDATFGENLALTFPALLEYVSMQAVLPQALQENPLMSVTASLVLLAIAWLLVRSVRGRSDSEKTSEHFEVRRSAVLFGLVMATLFIAFYGLWFGAGYFMSRYMFALSPLCTVLLGYSLASLTEHLERGTYADVAKVLVLGAVALIPIGILARNYQRGSSHMHFQVVEWVAKNVPDSTWVGAVQSGTLGYFHDRSINLDGKVNPYALAARKTGRGHEYVVNSHIEFMVDWAGVEDWMRPGQGVDKAFEVAVVDREQNLGVLRRRAPAPSAPKPVEGIATGDGPVVNE